MSIAMAPTPAWLNAGCTALETLERRRGGRHTGRPEQHDRRLARERVERSGDAGERPSARTLAPGTARTSRSRTVAPRPRRAAVAVDVAAGAAANGCRLGRAAFDDADPRVEGKTGEGLCSSRWPVDSQRDDAFTRAEPEQQLFRVLRQESRSRLDGLRPAHAIGFDGDARPNRIAIALDAGEPDRQRRRTRAVPPPGVRVAKSFRKTRSCGAWRAAITHEVLVAIAIEVEQRERPAVLIEVEPERAGDLVEAAVTVVPQEHVPLSAGDRSVHQQLVDRPPRLVVRAFPESA